MTVQGLVMTGLKPYRQPSATAKTLKSGTEARIHKLVLRTLRYNFGVESSLRRAVELGAREMLEAGASAPAVRQAIAQCVLSHPSVLPDKLSLVTGESHAATILKRMLAWTDKVVLGPPMDATR
jgi:hypothetical protein